VLKSVLNNVIELNSNGSNIGPWAKDAVKGIAQGAL